MDTHLCIGKAIFVKDIARYVRNQKKYMMFHDTTLPNTMGRTIQMTMEFNYQTGKRPSESVKEEGIRIVKERAKKLYNVVSFDSITYKGQYRTKIYSKKDKRKYKIKPVIRFLVTFSFMPNYYTFFCNKQDSAGDCLGHRMGRQKFINRYCGGKTPPQPKESR